MTRPTTTWKNFERKVADKLGGQRIPASGNGDIKGDVLHPHFLIEAKYGAQVPARIASWHDEAVRDAGTEQEFTGRVKVPVLVMQRPRGNAYAVVSLEDFADIVRRAGLMSEETGAQRALRQAAQMGGLDPEEDA